MFYSRKKKVNKLIFTAIYFHIFVFMGVFTVIYFCGPMYWTMQVQREYVYIDMFAAIYFHQFLFLMKRNCSQKKIGLQYQNFFDKIFNFYVYMYIA